MIRFNNHISPSFNSIRLLHFNTSLLQNTISSCPVLGRSSLRGAHEQIHSVQPSCFVKSSRGQGLWHSGSGCQLQLWRPVLECQLESQLLCCQSVSLLMCLGSRGMMAQVLGPPLAMWETRIEFLGPSPALTFVVIWKVNQMMDVCSLWLSNKS